MKLNYEGEDYTLDLDDIDVRQAKTIHTHAGLTLGELGEALANTNPDAMTAVFWLMLQQSGKAQPFDQINFKIIKFANAMNEAAEAEAEEKAAADKAAGKPVRKATGPKAS